MMTDLISKLSSFDWFNHLNKLEAIKIAEVIDSELDNLQRKALDPYAYEYHKKRLAGLKARLTFLFNRDTDEWLKAKVEEYNKIHIAQS